MMWFAWLWLPIVYALAGSVFAGLFCRWRQRRFLMRSLPWSPVGWFVSAVAVYLLVVALWPVYAWVTWRQEGAASRPPAEQAPDGPPPPAVDPGGG